MIHARSVSFLGGVSLAAFIAVAPAAAQPVDEFTFSLPAQDLGLSLRQVGLRTGVTISAPTELVSGRQAPAVAGPFTPEGAVRMLLLGSGLIVHRVGTSLIIARDAEDTAAPSPGGARMPEAAGGAAIVVTGTRIHGSAPVGSSVTVIDRSDIEKSGYATAQQLLQAVPQNFGGGPGEGTTGISVRNNASGNTGYGTGINLRGLGPSSTLVLLNGNRPPLGGLSGSFADLSLIPITAVERVEVLPDGASAIYGSDAVAGVVNIIPRLRFKGLEIGVRAGTADGDFGETQVNLLAGARWGRGGLVVAVEHYVRGRLPANERSFASDDLRAFGGPDYRLAFAAPGTIVAGGRTFAIPPGSGVGLTAAQLRADQVNKGDGWTNTDLLPEQRRDGVYVHADQAIAGTLSLYADVLGADRWFTIRPRPVSLAARTVRSTNPFYVDPLGTGQPVRVQYDFRRDLGPETQSGRVRAIGAVAGVAAMAGAWSFDLHGDYGLQTEHVTLGNVVNSARLAVALADPNPVTAFNLFGSGGFNNPATVASIRGSSVSHHRYRLSSVSARADGPLFDLPGGAVRLALGGEYREEVFSAYSIGDRSGLQPVRSTQEFPGPRRIAAAHAELLVPLFGAGNRRPGFESLLVSLAGRVEHYSDVGTTANPKLGVSWSPVPGATLRASFGTSFRAPSFSDLQQGPDSRLYFTFGLPDPASPTGTTNALVLRGNDPNLRPERATTWTAGVELEPRFAPGVKLEATWFDIRYRDRIADPSDELFNILANRNVYGTLIDASPDPAAVARYFADQTFLNLAGIPPSGVQGVINATNQNLSVVRESGLDFDLRYRTALLGGKAEAGVSGTWIAHLRQGLTPTTAPVSILGTLGNPVSLRWRGRLEWSSARFGVAAFANHSAGYRNTTVAVPEPIAASTTFDLQLSAMIGPERGRRLKLAFNVQNLFDRPPPYVNNYNGINAVGYDPENASAVGRMISAQATVTW